MGMQAGGPAGGPGEDLNSDINVTPLVDVMLVLLVIFMITAPMMTTGVDVDLPDTEAAELEDTEGKLILSIGKGHELFLGATPVPWQNLEVKLAANERVQREKTLWIEADEGLQYNVVVTAMAIARKAGVSKLMMLTDPTASLDLAKLDDAVVTKPAPQESDEEE